MGKTTIRQPHPLGIPRLLGACEIDNRPFIHCQQTWTTVLAEFTSVAASTHEAGEILASNQTPFGKTPLFVLTRDPNWGQMDSPAKKNAWQEMQQELAHLSTDSLQTVVTGSGHDIPEEAPQVVIRSVGDVLDAVRNKVPLNTIQHR
jgi:hypothetical protein